MSAVDFVNVSNAALIERMAEQYRRDPESLDPTWRAFFAGMEIGREDGGGAVAAPRRAPRASGLVAAYRDLGHLLAHLDPLSDPPTMSHPALELSPYSLSEADLDLPCDPGNFRGAAPATLRDLVAKLRSTYCGTLGVEYTQIRDQEHRLWLEEQIEGTGSRPELDRATKLRIYTKLVEAESFEQFLHKKYPGTKRFSVEGGETLIPILEGIIETGATSDV